MPSIPTAKLDHWKAAQIESELDGVQAARGNLSMAEKLAQKLDVAAYQTDKAAIEAEIVAAEKAGAKNFCPYNTLTASSAGTIINDQPISLPAGTYILTFKHTATAGSTAFRFSYNGTSVQSFTVNNTDTGSKIREFTLDSEVNQFRVYTAVANTYTEVMIRQAGASAGYQPYAPTNRELYEMILALQGNRNLSVQPEALTKTEAESEDDER